MRLAVGRITIGTKGVFVKATVEAVFQNGVFKPVRPPEIPEGERVRITFERLGHATPEEVLQLASDVYEGLSPRRPR